MDVKIKKCCPNCSQLYFIKSVTGQKPCNLPLYLTCGHTMCENCISNIVKCEEPIECKVCHRDIQLSADELAAINAKKVKLHHFFPVNLTLLGELTMQLFEQNTEHPAKKDEQYFVDLKSIIQGTDNTQGQCAECHVKTTKMCQECQTVLCDSCFNKSHKNFIIFKNHVLKNIEKVTVPNNCKVHKGKPLDYYCHECSKSICMDCLMVGGEKSCKNHNIVSMQEVNDSFLEDIIDITPKVDETFRRLTKTAVDVGHLLHNVENETGSSSELNHMLASVKQHFSKLTAAIQKHEKEVVDVIVKLKCSEKESLHKAKNDLTESIKKAKAVLNSILASSDKERAKQMNLSVLLDEAKQILEIPWYLCKDESKDPLKVAVNEDVCNMVTNYIQLQGNASSVYALRSTTALGEGVEIPSPPPAPVYPPELPKDVRQMSSAGKVQTKAGHPPMFYKNVPKYRAKSGSVSSLNSLPSDASEKSFGDAFYNQGYQGYQNYQRPMVQQVQPFPDSNHPKKLYEGDGFQQMHQDYQNYQRLLVHQVQPVPKTKEPKPLIEGCQELVYMTHMVDPHNFFVQRTCHQKLVKEMLREFRTADTHFRPSLNHIAEGKVYLVFNKADNMWQRCRVVSIDRKDPNNPKLLVFCIDFGSTESVSIDKLRLLPSARVQSPYALAISCALANCEPRGVWTTEDNLLIQKIVDNKQVVMHVRQMRSTAHNTIKVECDLTTFEHGISLAHALVFHERARMPNSKLMYPKIMGVMEKPKIFMSTNDLKPKAVEEVYITHIVSPDKFYVRKKHLMPVYEKLCKDLEEEYGTTHTGNVYLPEIGMSYVANVEKVRDLLGLQLSETGAVRWCRCVVRELPGRGRVRVALVDCGAVAILHWTALRYIHHKFTTQTALATECHLAGVTPLMKKWSEKSVALLQRFEAKLLELHVEDTRRGSAGVTLYDKSDEDNIICVNTEMIKYKCAVTFGLPMFNKGGAVEDQVFTNKSPLDEPQRARKPLSGQKQILKKNQPVNTVDEEDLDAKDKGPLRLEAKILQYQSPSLLYLSLVHQQKAFSELFEQIQEYYTKNKTQGKEKWEVGDRCCTVCNQSQTWRRAAIVEITGTNAKVFYSDFACIETVPLANLKELAPQFMGFGDAAIKCHLCGILPADGRDDWPAITKEFLKELIDAYTRIFITKLGNFKDKSMPVELWVYHTIQGGALEPNKSEWRCLNQKIVDQGLAVPDKSLAQTSTDTDPAQNDVLSTFLKNVTGSVDEWLQLEPIPTKPVMLPAKRESQHSADDEEEDMPSEGADSSNTVFITDWLPPEPLQAQEFTAIPTYIDNEGVIYLHDVTQKPTMDIIRAALDVHFRSADPKSRFTRWSVGEPCVARYYLDSRFYRGRVLEVDADAAKCLVQYVDFGNEELCAYEDMRKSIPLHQIPVQARRCSLGRIRPAHGRWDRHTLDYIHKAIVEKNCLVRVTGPPIGEIVPIDLKFDKLWLSEHLVEFEMAVYVDGSKAVVPKFAGDRRHQREPEPDPQLAAEADSSGPDYIVEGSETGSCLSLDGKDWNDLMQEEEQNNLEGKFIAYPKNDLSEFTCIIPFINDMTTLELTLVQDEETTAVYESLFEEVQREGSEQPPVNGMYEHKACVAVFPEDGKWYRAAVLEYSEARGKVKVRYVDYGNVAVVSVAEVREIADAWAALPPATITARLGGVRPNPDTPTADVTKACIDTFLDKGPFEAKVIKTEDQDSIPYVELRDASGNLVYENLIKSGLFLKDPIP